GTAGARLGAGGPGAPTGLAVAGHRRAAPGLRREEPGEVGAAHRPGEGVALEDVAAEIAQDAAVLPRLHPLAHDLDVQRLADIDDGGDEPPLRRGLDDGRDQLAVDLEPLRPQLHEADD